MSQSAQPVFGAILAGGRSTRFGSDKRVAELAGVPLVRRACDSVRQVVDELVLVTSDGAALPELELPTIADTVRNVGPLSGIHSALRWATMHDAAGVLVVGSDTPFLPPGLLREIVSRGIGGGAIAVAPESGGPRGLEPLCAWYSAAALRLVQSALLSSRFSPNFLLMEMETELVPLEVVAQFGDPTHIFLNVNTPDDLRDAEAVLGASR